MTVMPSLLQINSTVGFGSTGKIVQDLQSHTRAHGWKSYAACGWNANQCGKDIYELKPKWEKFLHGASTRLFDNHGFGSPIATKRLIHFIRGIEPNVIHLHNLHGYYLNLEVLLTFLHSSSIPTIMTLHDCWPFTGHCCHFESSGCNRWIDTCGLCPEKAEYPKSIWLDRSRQNFIKKKELFSKLDNLVLVPVSAWMNKNLDRSFLSRFERRVILNGIDVSVFDQANFSSDEQRHRSTRPIVLGVARAWGRKKGLDDFIGLSKKLAGNANIVLIGVDPREARKLPENVTTINGIEDQMELARWYSRAAVFVNPTKDESFGLTNVESLACGTPVVTYDSGGARETVDKATGVVVKRGQVDDLYEAVCSILQQDKKTFSRACRNRAVRYFSRQHQNEKYEALYKDILHG